MRTLERQPLLPKREAARAIIRRLVEWAPGGSGHGTEYDKLAADARAFLER
jgi:hypothetical protein